MKKIFTKYFMLSLLAISTAFLGTSMAFADFGYPYSTPIYTPSAVSPAVTYSAPAVYKMTLNNINTTVVVITGTCTALSAAPKASVDGVNYVQVNEYVVTNASSGVAAASNVAISAVGTYRFNTAGMKYFELNITALTSSCTVSASGSSAAFTNLE